MLGWKEQGRWGWGLSERVVGVNLPEYFCKHPNMVDLLLSQANTHAHISLPHVLNPSAVCVFCTCVNGIITPKNTHNFRF